MNEPVIRSKKPPQALKGRVRAPGDKSISHRALILSAMANGTSKITGLLEGEDILHTAEAMRAFGAKIERLASGHWRVRGCGDKGWQTPTKPVDFGNAGTGARLVMGAAAGFDLQVSYQGDESLSSRPMGRVLQPLSQMGAQFDSAGERLPIRQIKGGNLRPICYTPPQASAQVKSAILLAGLNTEGVTEVRETHPTRDHTENMLAAFGVPVFRPGTPNGNSISVKGPVTLSACDINVPGDPSSAAFVLAAALLVPGSDIVIENVMLNATRTGLFEVLVEMGADIKAINLRRSGGETVADLCVRHSPLCGVDIPAARVPSMVDEYPILAVIAATAKGETRMRGLSELRVKESDRLSGTLDLLLANGVQARIDGDDLIVKGGRVKGGGLVKTHNDHRLAMSALILGLVANKPVRIDDASMIKTSFPNFFKLMADIGAKIDAPSPQAGQKPVIAIDGTFASGKGTLAKKLADFLDFAYLDTGKLYRAVALRAIQSGVDLTNGRKLAGLAAAIKTDELDNPMLKSGEVGAAASKVAVLSEVRAALKDLQKGFADNPGQGFGGAVLDGRDIGTVICPHAEVKLYVDAQPDIRAERRYKELLSYGEDVSLETVLADLRERDARDKSRAEAPLRPAENAHLLDTTNLSIDAAFEQAKALVLAVLEQK